jgi:ABC-2 type transport system permease protein
MAGIETDPQGTGASAPELSSFVSSRQHFRTIAWLRWRIFVNTLRGKGAVGELVVKILSYPLLALIILGPSVGSGIGAYLVVKHSMDTYLAAILWLIFFLWQFIGVSTSATGPNFDVATLTRFPIRFRDYLAIRLSFGLMDPPTLAGIGCLIAMTIGIGFAAPAMAMWAALLLFLFAACNVLFSRMIYSWLERWLAQRRTRELFTGLLLVFSLAAQFVGQFADRLGRHGHHGPMNPFMEKASHLLIAINLFLPPGLVTTSFDHMHHGVVLPALAALGGLLLYTVSFLIFLNLRLRAEYRGENLSEAPAAMTDKEIAKQRKQRAAELAAARASSPGSVSRWISPPVAACFIKELRYLMRSGPKLYVLVMPVFMIVLISLRTAGLRQAGLGITDVQTFLFSSGCAYAMMIMVGFLYNAVGADGPGVQFYFMAPIRFRDVIVAKNLMAMSIFAIEVTLMYIASAFLGARSPFALTMATVSWCLFAILLNVSIGNIRSLVSPKAYEAGKVRRQNVSGLNSLISLAVTLLAAGLGSALIGVCRYLHVSYWAAAGAFLAFAILASIMYLLTLNNIDGVAANHMERMMLELCKR